MSSSNQSHSRMPGHSRIELLKQHADCGQRVTTVNFLTAINWFPKTDPIDSLWFGDFAFYGSMPSKAVRIGFCESCASAAVKSDESGETRTKISTKFPKSTCDFIRPSAFPDAFVRGFEWKDFVFGARGALFQTKADHSIIGVVPVSTTRAHRRGFKFIASTTVMDALRKTLK